MLIVVHYCYRFLCTVVTDSCALNLPFSVHSSFLFTGALEDGNRQLEPIPSDGEYTFTGIGTYFATEETETEFDFDGRLNEIRVSAPVYTIEKEYTVYRTITDYDKYDVLEDGTKVYYEYDEEIISERVVSRNLNRWESKTFTVSYY